jgi:hypothetical protein
LNVTIDRLIEKTRTLCVTRLAAPDLHHLTERLSAITGTTGFWQLTSHIQELEGSQDRVRFLKTRLAEDGDLSDDGAFERCLLLDAAAHACSLLPTLPVTARVKECFCAEFNYVATAGVPAMLKLPVGSARFTGLAKTVTLRRFPAGQFDWEVSGIPRSALLRVNPARLPGIAAFVVWRMRGLGPVFFSHLNPRRPSRSLSEMEANRSYYQMARTMEMQPQVRGFAAWSWFRSPATHAVSPHLAWLSQVFLENGGRVVEAGPEPPDGGVLYRSETRRRLYDSGQFRPTKGLVLWPRRAMLDWAAAHPEFETGATGQARFDDRIE